MKNLLPALLVFLFLVIFSGCSPSAENKAERMATTETAALQNISAPADMPAGSSHIPPPTLSSSAAVEKGSDTSRRFIRTADLRFRVPDVIKTTYKIEDIILANRGFVSFTNLTSELNYEENMPLTADSSLIITHFSIRNDMTLRVPNTKLDTTLKQIAPLIEFLDYRVIKASDVAIDLLANRLAQKRAKKHDQRLAKEVDEGSGKPKDITAAAESLLSSQESADQALLSTLSLQDQINYSTITLQLYQRPSVKHTLVANEKSIRAYEPAFWQKAWDALQSGFNVLKALLLFFIQIWWLILLIVIGFVVYPRIRRFGKKPPVS